MEVVSSKHQSVMDDSTVLLTVLIMLPTVVVMENAGQVLMNVPPPPGVPLTNLSSVVIINVSRVSSIVHL